MSKPIDQPALLIQIKINASLWPYIASKPLHPSQKVINKTSEHTTIQLDIIPNYEFYAQIMGFGAAIEVLDPIEIREVILQKLKENITRYLE